MGIILSKKELARYKNFDTPTICNAIETFKIRPRNEGYMEHDIKCIYPEMGVMVGYAVTLKFTTIGDDKAIDRTPWFDFLKTLVKAPKPAVAIFEDATRPPYIPRHAAFFGEIVCSTLKACGVIGLITNGAIRDIEQVRAIGFHYFAPAIIASHGKLIVSEFNTPVQVGGIEVKSGDLVHADMNGVTLIPDNIADRVADAAQKFMEREAEYLSEINSKNFSLDQLKELMTRL